MFSSSDQSDMLSTSRLIKERAKPLPQEWNACTSLPSVWNLLEYMPTHEQKARVKCHGWIGLACGGLGVRKDLIVQPLGIFQPIASPQ